LFRLIIKLIFILDFNYFGDDWLTVAEKAAPHCDRIWFRIKGRTDREISEYALRLRKKLPQKTLILSERADIAKCAGFEGVHLNSCTMPPSAVKRYFPDLTVGYSAHSPRECMLTGADYVTLSPVLHTEKGYEVSPLGVIPAPAAGVYALGGINADTAGLFKGLGYEGVAGIRLFSDIEKMRNILS